MAGQGAARGHHQLYGVPDHNGVVGHEAILGILQHRPLHKFAVAVAISGIWVLASTADLDCTLQAK